MQLLLYSIVELLGLIETTIQEGEEKMPETEFLMIRRRVLVALAGIDPTARIK